MQTFVIGGAGFLGSHIGDALLQDNHSVTVLSRSPASAAERLRGAVEIVPGDINSLDHIALTELLSPFDGLVYAAGADERTVPDIDATEFYCRENVELCRKVLTAAHDTKISQTLLGYGGDAIDTAFAKTVSSVPELTMCDGWGKLKAAIKPGPAG